MPLYGPDDRDIVKLHEEINQLNNQRFTLNTIALTSSAVMTVGMMSFDEFMPNSKVTYFFAADYLVGITLLLFFLGLMFYISTQHYNMFRTLTTYLIITDSSGWEKDWKCYRCNFKNINVGFSRWYKSFYLVLGAVPVLFGVYEVYRCNKYVWNDAVSVHSVLLLVVLVLYVVFIRAGFFTLTDEEIMRRWGRIQIKSNGILFDSFNRRR